MRGEKRVAKAVANPACEVSMPSEECGRESVRAKDQIAEDGEEARVERGGAILTGDRFSEV